MTSYYGGDKFQRSWRPVSIADANRSSASWLRRLEAQDLLEEMSFEHQLAAAACALHRNARESELKAAPQRAPLYTQFPGFPAARACLGLTAIAEFNVHSGGPAHHWLRQALRPSAADAAAVDPAALARVTEFVVEAVGNRMCIDHLRRFGGISAVESFRLFACALLDLRFTRLKDVVVAACLLGDLVFALVQREEMSRRIHPLTLRIFAALSPPCSEYEDSAATCSAEYLPAAGTVLAAKLLNALMPFLPPKPQPAPAPAAKNPLTGLQPPGRSRTVPRLQHFPLSAEALSTPVQGSDELVPPGIDDPPPLRVQGPRPQAAPGGDEANRLPGQSAAQTAPNVQAIIQKAVQALAEATGRAPWDDPRVDQVADALRRAIFAPGLLHPELSARPRRVAAYGSAPAGVVREETLPRCRNREAVERIRKAAAPIEKKLRHLRWFGEREEPTLEHFHSRGGLDPRRLHALGASPLIYRRWAKQTITDYRGRPVVLLAKDGSSSNTLQTTFAGQTLAAAFIMIQRFARLRVVAADYSSGATPLVRWLYHPGKTPGSSPADAVEAVAALPPKGQGSNEDVLSLSHVLRETVATLGTSQVIHLINVTDGKFNSPLPAVRAMIKAMREQHRLTYSIIVLGDTPVNLPEADHVVRIPTAELNDSRLIADRVAKHVNLMVVSHRVKGRKNHEQQEKQKEQGKMELRFHGPG